MMLDPNSPVPLYSQLADLILGQIQSGYWKAGLKIPSEYELAKKYGVGRPTVRQATDLLVRRRILQRRKGSGTYVLSQDEEINLFSLAGSVSAFKEKGLAIERKITQEMKRRDDISDLDNPFFMKWTIFFQRISLFEKKPFLLENIFLHPSMFPGIEAYDFSRESLSGVIQEIYNQKVGHGKQIFSVASGDQDIYKLLEVAENTPLLSVKRHLFFYHQQPGLYAEMFCTPKPFAFTQIIGGNL